MWTSFLKLLLHIFGFLSLKYQDGSTGPQPPPCSSCGADGAEQPGVRGQRLPKGFRVPVQVPLLLYQRDAAHAVCDQTDLQPGGVHALRQRRGRVPRGERAGAGHSRVLQQPEGSPGAYAGRDRDGVQTQLRGAGGPQLPAAARAAHGGRLPVQDGGPQSPQHAGLLGDRFLPSPDQSALVPEWPGGDGGGRVHTAYSEWGLDLPDPGDAGDDPSAGGRLHLPRGAPQPAESCHCGVAGAVRVCPEQDAERHRGPRAGADLPGAGPFRPSQESERISRSSSSRAPPVIRGVLTKLAATL